MQHTAVPRHIQEAQYLAHHRLRMQHQLLVIDHHAAFRSDLLTLIVHRLDRLIPLAQTLAVTGQIETCYCHLPRNYRVDGGATIADHKEELRLWEEINHITAHFQCQRVLVAQPRRRVAVFGDDLQAELRYCTVQYFLRGRTKTKY